MPLTRSSPPQFHCHRSEVDFNGLGVHRGGLIRLLMVNVTGLVTETPVAPFTGLVETRVNDPLP